MRYLILTSLLVLSSLVTQAQSILHVNPAFNNNVTHFSDLQAAVDAASDGDVLNIYPGGYAGRTVVNKRLHIIGRGYNLFENYPTTNTQLTNARIDHLDVESGGSGTLIQGVEIAYLRIKEASNCVIEQNLLRKVLAYDASTLLIRKNYIDGLNGGITYGSMPGCGTSSSGYIIITKNIGNLTIKNNIIVTQRGGNYYRAWGDVSCDSGYSASVDFQYNYCNSYIAPPPTSIFIANNQLNTSSGSLRYTEFGLVINNVALRNIPDGNQLVPSFTTELALGDNSFDGRYQLLPTAQSKGYATDGGDIGPFGGTSPYKLSGVTALPFIYEFTVPDEASTGEGVDVNVKVSAQN